MQHKHILVIGAVATLTPLLMGAYGWLPTSAVNATAAETSVLTNRTTKQVITSQTAIVKAIQDNTSIINEAIRSNIQQEALAATQIANADLRSREIRMAAEDAVDASKNVIKVQLDYGPHTGQGYKTCKVYKETQQTSAAVDEAVKKTNTLAKTGDNAPGKMVANATKAIEARNKQHARYFCSEEEVTYGMNGCKAVGQLPGGDSNASILFEDAKKGSPQGNAKNAVRQNILGKPIEAIPKELGQTAPAQAYLLNTNRKMALSAFPAHSLAYLQAMSEIRDDLKDAKGNPVSPNQLIHNTITRYYGGPESIEWRKSLNQQRPRGQLVELAKIEGIDAWLSYQRHLSNQRIGANIASLVLTESIGLEDQLQKQHEKLSRVSGAGYGR